MTFIAIKSQVPPMSVSTVAPSAYINTLWSTLAPKKAPSFQFLLFLPSVLCLCVMCDVGERHWQDSHSLAKYYGAREKAGSQVPVSEFCLSQFSLTTLISFPGCGGENADMPVMSFCGPTFPEYFKKCCKGHFYLVSISKYVGVLSVPRTMLLRLLSLTVAHVLL